MHFLSLEFNLADISRGETASHAVSAFVASGVIVSATPWVWSWPRSLWPE